MSGLRQLGAGLAIGLGLGSVFTAAHYEDELDRRNHDLLEFLCATSQFMLDQDVNIDQEKLTELKKLGCSFE